MTDIRCFYVFQRYFLLFIFNIVLFETLAPCFLFLIFSFFNLKLNNDVCLFFFFEGEVVFFVVFDFVLGVFIVYFGQSQLFTIYQNEYILHSISTFVLWLL